MNKTELIQYIDGIIKAEYGGSQAAFANANKLSKQYLCDVMKGRREPGQKIFHTIGVRKVVSYVLIDCSDH